MAKDVLLSGKAKWCKLFKPESYQNGPPKYSMVLYFDKGSRQLFDELKLRNHIKADDEGEYVTLRREHDPKVYNGKIIPGAEGGPPKVVDAEGNAWDSSVLVGNGSRVSVVLNVYDTRMGPGSRIARVRIDEHIPYNPEPLTADGAVPF